MRRIEDKEHFLQKETKERMVQSGGENEDDDESSGSFDRMNGMEQD
jgi:hypothetical protein